MKFTEWLAAEEMITEVDWKDDFEDVKKQCVNPKDAVEYLNAVRKNASRPYGDREKFPANKPFVHAKSSFFRKGEEEVDIDYFIDQITKPPKTVVNTNEKILKSGGPNEFVYKTGIPAFRGIAYDKDKGEFVYINTCPGAGGCVLVCYARRGRYIQYPNSYDNMTRRLNLLLNDPEEYENRLYKELKSKAEEHKAIEGYKPKIILRWNDSGDFFTKKYVKIAEDVIKKLNKNGYNVESYAYTKTPDIKPDKSVQTTVSLQPNKLASKENQKVSLIVPKELFKGLDFLKVKDEEKLKNNISDHFKLPKSKILTYEEMKNTPEGKSLKWNVIVTPNDGDDAAFRKDVKRILLTQH